MLSNSCSTFASMLPLPDHPCFFAPHWEGETPSSLTLGEAESHHASRVLRLSTQDQAIISNGKGTLGLGSISQITTNAVSLLVQNILLKPTQKPEVELLMAMLQHKDRLSWLVEKSVELGIGRLVICKTQRSASYKPNLDKLHKTAVAALKQSRKAWMPEISYAPNWAEALLQMQQTTKAIAHCHLHKIPLNQMPISKGLSLAIGPEGDFSPEEVQMAVNQGYQVCSLGQNRLRSETAAIFSLSAYHFACMNNAASTL